MIAFPPLESLSDSLSGLPAVTRATGLICGLIRQMDMNVYRGKVTLPRPRLLERPDPSPNTSRAWWVGVQVEDYLIHGNAVHLVTARSAATGRPLAGLWLPASHLGITTAPMFDDLMPTLRYWYNGRELPTADVVHVQRGADRFNPMRGVGVVEQHLTAFSRLQKQQNYESDAYDTSGVPSIAVITPKEIELTPESADIAKTEWMERFRLRQPVILPSGSEVKPLAWSPSDSQMIEAHQMSLQDVANMFGMDGSWLGAPIQGMTYKSVGPMFLSLVRETVEPVSDEFEQVWGDAWLPYGQELRFHKPDILADDLPTEMGWMYKALRAKVITLEEVRTRLGLSPEMPAGTVLDLPPAPADPKETEE